MAIAQKPDLRNPCRKRSLRKLLLALQGNK